MPLTKIADRDRTIIFRGGDVFDVPVPVFREAVNRTIKENGRHPDKFKTEDRRMVKEYCGPQWGYIDEDKFGIAAITLRKRSDGGVIKMRGGHGPSKGNKKPNLSKELLDHYKSEFYNMLKDSVMLRYGRRCQVCNGVATELHHRHYGNIKTLDEYDDVIAVCRRCHKLCDQRRERQLNGE